MTTAWQKFTVTGALQNGLTAVAFQLGGSHTITGGALYDVWGGELGPTAGGAVTNILPSSQQVGGPFWYPTGDSVTSTSIAAPDGTNTAAAVTAPANSTGGILPIQVENPSPYSGQVVTASVYLRVPSGTMNLNLYIANSGSSGFSLVSAPVVVNTSWQRFSVTRTNETALTWLYLQIGGGAGASIPAGQTLDVWGAQMVVGSSPDGYIETQNTTAVTGTTQTLAANGLNEAYSYDSFGNLQEAGNYSFLQAYTAGNQLSGWSYDQAGNLQADGLGNSYSYDAEGKIKSAAGTTYVYDAQGQRVEKSGTASVDTVYFAGRPIARFSGGLWTDLIYSPNGLLVEVPETKAGVSGGPVYRMTDHLGSLVGTLSSAGAIVSTQDVAPFGEIFVGSSTDPFTFTGKERDAESGNDFFGARYYASSMGRFMSPDPSGLLSQNPADPQSWNMYSYALNNPLTNIDPTGLDCVYFNKDGDAAESIDHNSNSGECGANGGDWVNGTTSFSQIQYNATSDTFNIQSSSLFHDYSTTAYAPSDMANATGTTCSGNCDTANGYSSHFSLANLQNSAFSVSGFQSLSTLILPVGGVPVPVASFGWSPTFTYIPKTKTGCVGVAAGISTGTGKTLSATVYPSSDAQYSKSVTSEWGWNLNAQPSPGAGVSVNTNSSGTLIGYTVATSAGASATYGYTWCKDF